MAHVGATAPYPWPYDGNADPGRLALVVVACQGWWAGRTCGAAEVLEALENTASAVREAGGLVAWVKTTASLPGSRRPVRMPERDGEGWELLLKALPDDLVVESPGLCAFYGSSLDLALRRAGRSTLAVGGLGLETTVYSTVTGANDRGYECLTLADASAPHDPVVGERALASITMSGGIFGAIGSASELRKTITS